MNKIELDESMLEQDRINRFLNMIATEYGGNLATEYGTYYINKCKKISELEKEIERLNNIINECAEDILKELEKNYHLSYGVALGIRQKLIDYRELKGE